jgi:hypothetical protein
MTETTPTPRNISFSQYTMGSTCAYRWKLKYIDGHTEDSNINLVFGTAMHTVIQHWLTLFYSDASKAKMFDMHDMLKSELVKGAKEELLVAGKQLTTPEELSEFYADGCKILDHVRKHGRTWFPATGHTLVGIEVPLLLDIGRNLKFKGFIDIVMYEKATKTYTIYDFKTSDRGWKDYQKKDSNKTDQLLLYKKYYSELFGVPIDNIQVEFIILKRKIPENTEFAVKHISGFVPAHGKPSMKKAMDRLEKWITDTFDEAGQPRLDNLPPTSSEKSCKFCPFKNDATKCAYSYYLPAGQRKVYIHGKSDV